MTNKLKCPCGFNGNSRNIASHRINCPAWHNKPMTNNREAFEKAYAEKYGIYDDEYPEFFKRRENGTYLSYRGQSDWEFFELAYKQGRQSMRDEAVQKVYLVEVLMDEIKNLREVYCVFGTREQAIEKAVELNNAVVTEWDIEAIKELP